MLVTSLHHSTGCNFYPRKIVSIATPVEGEKTPTDRASSKAARSYFAVICRVCDNVYDWDVSEDDAEQRAGEA
jgi:hypothetical protein